MLTVEEDEGQTPFATVHSKMFCPIFNPEITAAGLFMLLMLPAPLKSSQLPDPASGTFAFSVAEDEQTVWLLPAFEAVGGWSHWILTVDEDVGQTPFEMVHAKVFGPKLRPETLAVGLPGGLMVPLPDTRLHAPEPVAGLFALNV